MSGNDMSPAEIGLALIELARTEPHAAAILGLIRYGRECNHTDADGPCGAPAVTVLDGDPLCKRHADAWVRAEGFPAHDDGTFVDPGEAGRAVAEALGAERPFRYRTRPGGGQVDEVARRAVDEALGAEGPGPFGKSYRDIGGSTRPVIHSEDPK
jgi:hypothetical protein